MTTGQLRQPWQRALHCTAVQGLAAAGTLAGATHCRARWGTLSLGLKYLHSTLVHIATAWFLFGNRMPLKPLCHCRLGWRDTVCRQVLRRLGRGPEGPEPRIGPSTKTGWIRCELCYYYGALATSPLTSLPSHFLPHQMIHNPSRYRPYWKFSRSWSERSLEVVVGQDQG